MLPRPSDTRDQALTRLAREERFSKSQPASQVRRRVVHPPCPLVGICADWCAHPSVPNQTRPRPRAKSRLRRGRSRPRRGLRLWLRPPIEAEDIYDEYGRDVARPGLETGIDQGQYQQPDDECPHRDAEAPLALRDPSRPIAEIQLDRQHEQQKHRLPTEEVSEQSWWLRQRTRRPPGLGTNPGKRSLPASKARLRGRHVDGDIERFRSVGGSDCPEPSLITPWSGCLRRRPTTRAPRGSTTSPPATPTGIVSPTFSASTTPSALLSPPIIPGTDDGEGDVDREVRLRERGMRSSSRGTTAELALDDERGPGCTEDDGCRRSSGESERRQSLCADTSMSSSSGWSPTRVGIGFSTRPAGVSPGNPPGASTAMNGTSWSDGTGVPAKISKSTSSSIATSVSTSGMAARSWSRKK